MTVNAIPVSSTSSALTVQGRVLAALILRDIYGSHGNSKLGYLWAVIQTACGLGIFWAFRAIMGAHAPYGMSLPVFLLCSFIPWNIFNQTLSRCMAATSANQALLTFPQVTELDLMLGRLVVVWGTQILCGGILLALVAASGQSIELRNPECLAATFFFTPLLGLGLGFIFASLARLWPTLDKLIPLLKRVLFFASGIFFAISELPARLSGYLMLNPVAQLIEWQRYGFSTSSAAPLFSVTYIAVWCVVSLCIGLLLERYVRGRVFS